MNPEVTAARPSRQEGTHSEDLPSVAGTGQLLWTREEIILAMDFYVSSGALGGGPVPGKFSSKIARLSALLKTLGAYPPEIQGETYRNTNGVYQCHYMKSIRRSDFYGQLSKVNPFTSGFSGRRRRGRSRPLLRSHVARDGRLRSRARSARSSRRRPVRTQ